MREKNKISVIPLNTPLHRDNKLFPFSMMNNGEDCSRILRIKEIIDNTTEDIFISYKNELLTEPITYIIPAVWGKIRYGKLTASQMEIYRTLDPAISDILEMLELDEISDSQGFAIEYLIRGLIISKITYLIEASRNCVKQDSERNTEANNLF